MASFSKIIRAAQHALKTEQGRSAGRKAVDGIAKAGNRVTGDKHASAIEKARLAAQKRLGDERR
ncbi:MAG: hypothetical protein ABW204_11035 [Microbacteriaceae bacterium]